MDEELEAIAQNVDLTTLAVKVGVDRDYQIELLLICVASLGKIVEKQDRRIKALERLVQ